jgi:hypothetical protein
VTLVTQEQLRSLHRKERLLTLATFAAVIAFFAYGWLGSF